VVIRTSQELASKAAFTPGQHVLLVYLQTVSRRHNYYSFISRSTCIPLYPATDGRQTWQHCCWRYKANMLTAKRLRLYSIAPKILAAPFGWVLTIGGDTHTAGALQQLLSHCGYWSNNPCKMLPQLRQCSLLLSIV